MLLSLTSNELAEYFMSALTSSMSRLHLLVASHTTVLALVICGQKNKCFYSQPAN